MFWWGDQLNQDSRFRFRNLSRVRKSSRVHMLIRFVWRNGHRRWSQLVTQGLGEFLHD